MARGNRRNRHRPDGGLTTAGGEPYCRPRLKTVRSIALGRWDVEVRRAKPWRQLTAPQLFVGSFAALVLVATIGLRWLPGLYAGERLGWLDCLFTATSAVCVTGLTVVDTATAFTPLGQLYLLALIQLGGLGMIAFTSLIIISLGRRLSLRSEALSTGDLDVAPGVSRQHLIRDVVLFTFAIEAAGAVVLYGLFVPRMGFIGAAWPAVFHAVSAFCNAGFSTFSDSLVGYNDHPLVLLAVVALIVAGGLGFLTLEELRLYRTSVRSRQRFRVSLHTRIVLAVTAGLILLGWPMYAAFEWHGTLRAMPVADRVSNALFMSVTARTAGFNTIDYGRAAEDTNFLTILLMAIGGSPGSTAGGIKTTTVALLGLLAWSRFRGRRKVTLVGRTVPDETVERAVGLFVAAFGLMTAGIFVMASAERGRASFLAHMFEAVSAFNTVGLTMGPTPDLTPLGRWTAIALMFLGRVGPLTFAAALAVRADRAPALRYASEDVVVG